jgi:tetratricopeptide (TPR) repeat protein
MQKLGPPESHHLLAAIGWLELGSVAEANAELASLEPGTQQHPDVLEVRWAIHAEEQNWVEALAAARSLLQADPKRSSGWLHQAYALRRVPGGGLQAAWDALVPAYHQFPGEATIAYNLSCYACQLSQLEEARKWFRRALKIGGKEQIKSMALHDSDLEPLRQEIFNL